MNLVVTGGSGKIGQVVAQKLATRGHSVTVLDIKPPVASDLRFLLIDLRDPVIVARVIEGCDAVIHLGEIADPCGGGTPRELYLHNTTVATTVLHTAAELNIKRILYTSSCQVYGFWGSKERASQLPVSKLPLDETQPLSPQNTYALAKVAAENYARLLSEQFGIAITAFRLPSVIPANAPRWLHWIEKTPDLQLKLCDGFWSFVQVEDVADAYVAAIEQPHSGFEACHLAATDLFGRIPLRQRIESCNLRHWPSLPATWPERGSLVDTTKAFSLFGWKPQHTYLSITEKHNHAVTT